MAESSKWRLLIVEDEDSSRDFLTHILAKSSENQIASARSGNAAITLMKAERPFDLILTDIRMLDGNGMEVLRAAKELAPLTEVIIMTGYASVDTALEAMNLGAFCYLLKPLKMEEIKLQIQRAKEKISLVMDNHRLHEELFQEATNSAKTIEEFLQLMQQAEKRDVMQKLMTNMEEANRKAKGLLQDRKNARK